MWRRGNIENTREKMQVGDEKWEEIQRGFWVDLRKKSERENLVRVLGKRNHIPGRLVELAHVRL